MSYCEINLAKKNGDVVLIEELRNSWGAAAYIWTCIWDEYIKDRTKEYDTWLCHEPEDRRLWAAVKNPKIPEFIRLVHGTTLDYAIVEYKKLPDIAKAFRRFIETFPPGQRACHLLRFADICERVYKQESAKTCAGVCFMATSCGDDLWTVYNEKKDISRAYNLKKDKKHWFLYEEFYKG